jgi:hypothetical protein
LPILIRDEAVEDPSGSSTLVAQEGGFMFKKKVFYRAEKTKNCSEEISNNADAFGDGKPHGT